jgi:hypothetical protein
VLAIASCSIPINSSSNAHYWHQLLTPYSAINFGICYTYHIVNNAGVAESKDELIFEDPFEDEFEEELFDDNASLPDDDNDSNDDGDAVCL